MQQLIAHNLPAILALRDTCLRLTLPTAERVVVFHHLVVAHAGRTIQMQMLHDPPGIYRAALLCPDRMDHETGMDRRGDGAWRKGVPQKKALYRDDPVRHAGYHADHLPAIHGNPELSVTIGFNDRFLAFCAKRLPLKNSSSAAAFHFYVAEITSIFW